MTPEVFAQAIVSIERNYGLRLDPLTTWLRMDATPCGRGWVGTKPPGCKRGEKEKKTAAQPMKGAEQKTLDLKAANTKVPAKEVKTKALEIKSNESEVLKSTLQRLKAKLEESIKNQKLESKSALSPEIDPAPKNSKKKAIKKNEGENKPIKKALKKASNVDTAPSEKKARKEKIQPSGDLIKGQKGSFISPSNVVATDKRFTSAAINNALDQIQSPGASERLSNIRSIIESQGIQAVFRSSSTNDETRKLAEGIENKGSKYKSASAFIRQAELERKPTGVIDKMRNDRDSAIVGSVNSLGYTRQNSRHVVLSTGQKGDYSSFSVTPKEMQTVADNVLYPKNGKLAFSTSVVANGAASDLMTYIHEVGHQIQWISESKDPSLRAKAPMAKPVSSYGAANRQELFAEGFALWTLDAKGLKAKNPEMHDYIQESVTAAMGAKRRMDSTDDNPKERMKSHVQPSDIAQTILGQKAFKIVLSGDLSWDAYKTLSDYASEAKGIAQYETMAAIEAFMVEGGQFDDPTVSK